MKAQRRIGPHIKEYINLFHSCIVLPHTKTCVFIFDSRRTKTKKTAKKPAKKAAKAAKKAAKCKYKL